MYRNISKYLSFTVLLCVCFHLSVYGQMSSRAGDLPSSPSRVSSPIYFPIGRSDIDPDFMGNRANMARFVKALRDILSNPDYEVDKVRVVGMASPDGSRERNEELAGSRARSIADFLKQETGLSDDRFEIVNGGENWSGLFSMIEASVDIPDKAKLLEFRDVYEDDRDGLKRSMQTYNGGRAWKYMYEHFFPTLRTGAGGTDGDPRLSSLSLGNWHRVRRLIESSSLSAEKKKAMLDVLSSGDLSARKDADSLLGSLRGICSDSSSYDTFALSAVSALLGESHSVSRDNWSYLRTRIASSDLPDKDTILSIIDRLPAARGLEGALRSLNGGSTYRSLERLYPSLLQSEAPSVGAAFSGIDSWEVFRSAVQSGTLGSRDRDTMLSIIEGPGSAQDRVSRLRALGDGDLYASVSEDVLPLLLSSSRSGGGGFVSNRQRVIDMVSLSSLPDKESVVSILDTTSDVSTCVSRLRSLDGGRTYRSVSSLAVRGFLTGEGTERSVPAVSRPSLDANWRILRETILASAEEDKSRMLSIIDNEPDLQERDRKLRELSGGRPYRTVTSQALPRLLSAAGLSREQGHLNRTHLLAGLEASHIQGKDAAVDILEGVSDGQDCVEALQTLSGGRPYADIVTELLPSLLTSPAVAPAVPSPGRTVSEANWAMLREMISRSDLEDKSRVLSIIDSTSDPAARLRSLEELNDGYTARYIKEVFFPELLYGLSPASKDNWSLLEKSVSSSDLPNKEAVLGILSRTPAGADRERALAELDGGKTWDYIRRRTFSDLLENTDPMTSTGTGMSFTFEASASAKARAEEVERQAEESRQAEERRRRSEEASRAAEQRRLEEAKARESVRQAAVEHRKLRASAGLKTDLVLWGSLMPGFETGSFLPNLSVEVYFAKRWSLQLGGGYSNWDALSGDKGLYAVTGVDLEPRLWLKDDGLYRGLYFGLYGTYGDFDVLRDTDTGYTGTYFMCGFTGGWSQVLGRHLYLEGAVRLGYRSANGDSYRLLGDHSYHNGTDSRGKFVPQVRLQFVYRFGKSGK